MRWPVVKLVPVFILVAVCAVAQTTQIRDWGVSMERNTDHIPDYELALMDELGSFGAPRSDTFRIVPRRDRVCIEVQDDGIYAISARAVWSVDGTIGVRQFSVRILRDSVWSTLAEDEDLNPSGESQTQQTVTIVDALLTGDCIGTLAYFESEKPDINFGVVSLLVTKLQLNRTERRRSWRKRR